jgi:hypothetical protein
MKRKLFTLLLVFVTLGAFYANAQTATKYWIKFDTTGIASQRNYPGVKARYLAGDWLNDAQNLFDVDGSDTTIIGIPNNKWLYNNGGIKVSASTTDRLDIYKGKPANVFTVKQVGNIGDRFTIAPYDAPTSVLSLPYGGQANTQFEVVRFHGGERETQTFGSGVNPEVLAGYLTPTQGGSATIGAFDDNLLLVGSSGQGSALSIKKFSEWAKYYDDDSGALSSPLVGLQINNKTWQAGRIYTVFNSVNSGFDIYDSSKGVFVLDSLIFGGNPSAAAPTGKYYGTWSFDNNNKSIPYDGDGNAAIQTAGNYAYAFLDLGIAADGTLTASDGTFSSLDDLVAVGVTNTHNGDPLFTTIDPTTAQADIWFGNFFVQINGGKVGLTFRYNTDGVFSWSNGAPTIINDQYYVLNIEGWLGSAGAAEVAANLVLFAELLEDVFDTDLTENDGEKLALKNPADKWQPLWVEIEPTCADPVTYITPEWLAENKLLSLPVSNQIYSLGQAANAWISTGADDEAIVSNTAPENKENVLTHTWATKIEDRELELGNGFTLPFPIAGYDLSTWSSVDIYASYPISSNPADFKDVDLYYVQNKEGYYLTVVPKALPTSTLANLQGVNGVALEWVKDKYEYTETDGYDKRVFQWFAVVGFGLKEQAPYGEFSYLPLASYVYDYVNQGIVEITVPAETDLNPTENDIVRPLIAYNLALGEYIGLADLLNSYLNEGFANCYPSADLDLIARIGYYTALESDVKQLVVYASPTLGGANITPIEVKLNKENILKPISGYVYVQDNAVGANKDKYYQTNGTTNLDLVDKAESAAYDLTAHWKLNYPTTGDTKVGKFAPELKKIYNAPVIPNQLQKEYYALEYLGDTDYDGTAAITEPLKVRFINLTGLTADNGWAAQYDTLTLVPATHEVPFLDLENPAAKLGVDGYDLAQKLALLEAPFVDRNLTDYVKNDALTPTTSYDPIKSYKTYIARVGEGYNETEYLNVYAVNKRELAEEHIVPYYAFSIIKNDGKEYFLNVKPASEGAPGAVDTVLWTTLTADNREILLNWDKKVGAIYPNIDAFPTYKFALPYQVNADSTRVNPIVFNDVARIPVHLQTYVTTTSTEAAANPYLLTVGAQSKFVNVVKYDNAFFTVPTNKIYSGDYSKINPEKVAAWIVGGQKQAEFEWVPIIGAFTEIGQEQVGVLTNYEISNGGATFVAIADVPAPAVKPVDYGALVGLEHAQNLTFEFVGDSVIGYNKKQIWYYKIKVVEEGEPTLYLTDTLDVTKTAQNNLLYDFNGLKWAYGFFTEIRFPDVAKYAAVNADSLFRQTFGLKYVDSSEDVQSFLVVSHADYQASNPVPKYRYLAEANNRLVFVDGIENGLVFQFGKNDGGYTDITVVGKSGIYGVEGGVKILNGTGKVDIYSIDGRLVKSTLITGADQTIAAPKGIVIVKNGANVAKVIFK